jgi:hypothetical protein
VIEEASYHESQNVWFAPPLNDEFFWRNNSCHMNLNAYLTPFGHPLGDSDAICIGNAARFGFELEATHLRNDDGSCGGG